jgi:hypothetical protein
MASCRTSRFAVHAIRGGERVCGGGHVCGGRWACRGTHVCGVGGIQGRWRVSATGPQRVTGALARVRGRQHRFDGVRTSAPTALPRSPERLDCERPKGLRHRVGAGAPPDPRPRGRRRGRSAEGGAAGPVRTARIMMAMASPVSGCGPRLSIGVPTSCICLLVNRTHCFLSILVKGSH